MEKDKKKNKEDVKKEKETRVKRNEKKQSRPVISKILVLFLALALLYIHARYVGSMGFKIKEYNIVDENIPASFDGFSIVQFSDLELGSTFQVDDLPELVEKINKLNPDVVVFTGDIVSNQYTLSASEERKLISNLAKIDPLIGKYSVRGDDDARDDLYYRAMEASGFQDISNSYELIYYKGLTPIVLYGLDSLRIGNQDYASTFSYPSPQEDTTYMATYRILLAHEPDTIKNIDAYNISLMLSGHSHNSEVNIPYLKDLYHIKGASTYYDEFYQVGNTELYVSSGLGTSKYKVRLFDKASISVFRLYTE